MGLKSDNKKIKTGLVKNRMNLNAKFMNFYWPNTHWPLNQADRNPEFWPNVVTQMYLPKSIWLNDFLFGSPKLCASYDH